MKTLLYTREDRFARIMINRPPLNAMTLEMASEMRELLITIADDPTINVVLLTGAGGIGNGFCPGLDLRAMPAGETDKADIDMRVFELPTLLHELPQVTIAALNGATAGAGLGWALSCDLRLAAESAVFNTAFLDLAVAGDMAGNWTLLHLVGAGLAKELYFLPRRFGAREAERMGIVNRAYADAEFVDGVKAVCERLAAADPTALHTMKDNFLQAERLPLSEYARLEGERHIELCFAPAASSRFAAYVARGARGD
jgi:2-(1,2-epoxy-1,2-dihydrophenyl)acetyl-CoA isomerase